MMRSMQKKRPGEAGFTLVELLVVIVILGVLAGIVVFAVGGINDKGTDSACQADKSSIETAQEAFYAVQDGQGHYTDMNGLVAAKFLHEPSTLHTEMTLTGGAENASAYNVGACSKSSK